MRGFVVGIMGCMRRHYLGVGLDCSLFAIALTPRTATPFCEGEEPRSAATQPRYEQDKGSRSARTSSDKRAPLSKLKARLQMK